MSDAKILTPGGVAAGRVLDAAVDAMIARIDGPAPVIRDDSDRAVGVTALYDGGFVAHWLVDSNNDGDADAVAVQRYAADGTKQGAITLLQGFPTQLLNGDVEAFDVAALDDGGYALSYALELEGFGRGVNLTASAQVPTPSTLIVGRPTQIVVQSAPGSATFSIVGTGNNGQQVTIPLTITDGVINITPTILDQLGVDNRMTLVVGGMPANQSATFYVEVDQDLAYDPSSALHDVARSVTVPSPANATSVGAGIGVPAGRAEAFHLNPPSFAAGVTPSYFLLVTPIAGGAMLNLANTPGAVLQPDGSVRVPVTLDANNNVAVPQSILQQLGDDDATIVLVVTGLVPGSTLSATVSVRDGIPQTDGVFVQTFSANGTATSDGTTRVDTPQLPLGGDDDFGLGMTPLDGGGFAIRWLVDANGDGDADGLAIQRFNAAGAKDGGVVTLQGIAQNLVNAEEVSGLDLVALDNGGYALAYALELDGYSRYIPVAGNSSGVGSVVIVGRPETITIQSAPPGATFSLVGAGPSGSVTIPLTVTDGVINITQAILDQLTVDNRMTLRISNMPTGQTAAVSVEVVEDVSYAGSPLHDVARSFTVPTGGTSVTASFSPQSGRAEAFHIDSVTFVAGAPQNHYLLVNPVQGGGAFPVGSIPGAVLQPNGQIMIPVTGPIAAGSNVAVPPALLAALGDHDATIVLILAGLQPGSTVSGTISVRDAVPQADGVYVQLFGANGVALGEPGVRLDAPGSLSDEDDNAVGITPLDGGGFVVRWLTDSNGDGDPDGISVQRYNAAGTKVGGVTVIDVASIAERGGEVESFDFAALANGGYALVYSIEPEWFGDSVNVTASAAGQSLGISIVGRPIAFDVYGNPPATAYALSGIGNNGMVVNVPLTAIDGRITITQAILDQFSVDNRLSLVVTGLAAGGSANVWIEKALDVTYDPLSAVHDVARNATVGTIPVGPLAGTGVGVLSASNGRAEGFHIDSARFAPGVTPSYSLQVHTAQGSEWINLSGIPGAGRTANGVITIPVTPDADGRVVVPASLLAQLGSSDASIMLVVLGLQPGSALTGVVTVRDAIQIPEGVFVQNFDAAGHPVGGDLTLTGDANANTLRGADGDDVINGGGGIDTIEGNAGDDRIDGGTSADRMYGGTGNDTFFADQQGDVVFENAGAGVDTVVASSNYYLYANIENLVLATGAGNIFGVGNDLANDIAGNAGNNLILGGGGNDVAHGNVGDDVVYGQDGDDHLFGDAGIDYLIGGAGNDVLRGGTESDGLYGEDGDDILWGGTGFFSDILDGGAGNDILHGDSGLGEQDHLNGGAGDDSYYVDSYADLTYEAVGGGTDTVYATINGTGYYLYANVENLVLGGNTPFGVGNELANRLTGSAAANWLLGGGGNDILNGKGGADVLFGEGGSDTFVFEVGTGGDTVGDFQVGVDKINLSAFGFTTFAQVQAAIGDNGGTSFINLGNGDFVVLNGVAKASLNAGDFILSGGSEATQPLAADSLDMAALGLTQSVFDLGGRDWFGA